MIGLVRLSLGQMFRESCGPSILRLLWSNRGRFSVYLYARRFDDAQLLRVAHSFESLTAISRKRKPYRVLEIDLINFVQGSML